MPHFDIEIVENCKKNDVNEISDFMNLEDNERNEIVKFNNKQLNEVAEICNRYPFIDMKVNVLSEEVTIGKKIEFEIKLERDIEATALPPINGGYFPCVILLLFLILFYLFFRKKKNFGGWLLEMLEKILYSQ